MSDLAPDPLLSAWAGCQPSAVTGDPVWRLDCYRHAAFLVALARDDAVRVAADSTFRGVAEQLLTSTVSIAANVAEGYGRPTARDRIRFLSYALGSAREAATWYAASGPLAEPDRQDRLARLVRVRQMLLGLLKRTRQQAGGTNCDRW